MPPITAIVVDDSESDRYLATRVLQKNEYIGNIEEFEGGEGVLSFLASDSFKSTCGPHPPPTLIFLDINMPGLTGFDVLDRVAEYGRSGTLDTKQGCMVMMLTSSDYFGDRDKSFGYDVVADYIEKPLNKAKLASVIESHYASR